ncbi:hypothetical protein C2845_PM01G25540 [Panicum miliaceum]|uniref:J domain-containing protein n=1 Tax=Panicum miliaceum TaxID=4540 RepID=A0A3L6TRV8_PANMI|nr:hypothetical protein C2845_PM01G25540 [Panicum miliaceum]
MARYEDEREQAEKACRYAEELFLAGNISGAHRHASKAKRLCPSLPGVANALAAYEVHAAAGRSWRAVLGIRPGAAATQDAIKKEYRRLSLLVHPDKALCAAAEGAFKLPMYYAPREPTLIYCPSCKNEYAAKIGRLEQQARMKCARCPEWLSPPWQKKPPARKEPTAVPGRQVFQCPAKCPECGAAYTSKVCVGRWCLRCKACTKSSMVDVQGPDQATATIRKRA